MNDINRLIDAISSAGLPPPSASQLEAAIAKGKPVRWSTNGDKSDRAGFCFVRQLDRILVASFGCMRSGFRSNWSAKSRNDMSEAQWKDHHQRMKEAAKKEEETASFKTEQAAIKAHERWSNAQPAQASNPYLLSKGVKPHGLKVEGETLLISIYNIANNRISSLQTISPNGVKFYMEGGAKLGGIHQIGGESNHVVICEGFATGASIHEATNYTIAVAFDCGNLLPVAQAIRAKFPELKLIIAADDDWKKNPNIGLTKAREAAAAVGGYLALPHFPNDRGEKDTDFNDLHRIAGLDEVRSQIEAATTHLDTDDQSRDGVELVKGSSLKPEPIQWLWQGWLPLGKLTILAGEPGTGKTTAVLSFAATVSNGGAFPDGVTCPEGDVLIWSGEDDPGDTLLPRLIAAGANTDRIFFVGDRTVTDETRPFDPATDVGVLLETALKLPKLRLIVFDPIVNAITGDSHKNTEVRRALQPLVDFASKVGAVLIGITHFSKGGQGSEPTKRVMGSVAFTAVARVVMVCAKTNDDEGIERRVFARSKSNVGPDDGGFVYGLEQVEALPGIWASRVVWGEALTGSAKSLLAEPDEAGKEGALGEAVQFLRDCLSEGLTPTKTIKAEALNAGFSWATVRRASESMAIIKRKGGMNQGWYWELQNYEDAQINRRCSTIKGEHLRENLSTFD